MKIEQAKNDWPDDTGKLYKLGIAATVTVTIPRHKIRPKWLGEVVDEVGAALPVLRDDLEYLLDTGNLFVHPRKTKASKAALFESNNRAHTGRRGG